jgi:hypothetical protein
MGILSEFKRIVLKCNGFIKRCLIKKFGRTDNVVVLMKQQGVMLSYLVNEGQRSWWIAVDSPGVPLALCH